MPALPLMVLLFRLRTMLLFEVIYSAAELGRVAADRAVVQDEGAMIIRYPAARDRNAVPMKALLPLTVLLLRIVIPPGVEDGNVPVPRPEEPGCIAADETGSPGDQNSSWASIFQVFPRPVTQRCKGHPHGAAPRAHSLVRGALCLCFCAAGKPIDSTAIMLTSLPKRMPATMVRGCGAIVAGRAADRAGLLQRYACGAHGRVAAPVAERVGPPHRLRERT